MGNFNRGRSGGGRGFERRGPAQMHQAVCDECRKECEVPFRPTSGKPLFCSDCFKSNRDFDSRPANFEEKRMFEAVCDECRNSCKVPFRPSGEKPVYCSNCFGDKKGNGDRNHESSQFQHKELFEALNNKLDKILVLLTPNAPVQPVAVVEEEQEEVIEEVVKKKPSKKK